MRFMLCYRNGSLGMQKHQWTKVMIIGMCLLSMVVDMSFSTLKQLYEIEIQYRNTKLSSFEDTFLAHPNYSRHALSRYHICTHTSSHWHQVTHTCVSKLTSIDSDSGLSPGRHQAIIWNNAGILITWSLGRNFSEIVIKIHIFLFKKMHL